MISVYYNQKYGFLIVPNAIERFMGCYISIEPTIEIMAEETIDKIGCAIRKGIKIAESSPKVDESQLNNFWKQTKYKSFPTFSKNYQRIDLKQNGDELEIRRWERNNRGGVKLLLGALLIPEGLDHLLLADQLLDAAAELALDGALLAEHIKRMLGDKGRHKQRERGDDDHHQPHLKV